MLKIAFVAQPFDGVLPPNQNSIGIIIYEIARRLAHTSAVTIYTRGDGMRKRVENIEGINFRYIPLVLDNLLLRYSHRISNFFEPRSPFFASMMYYFGYILQLALDLKRQQCDVVHIVNFSQFVPIIRTLNPRIKIVLHMECEWLTQLDYHMIHKRINNADLVIGCSDYITQEIRDHYPLADCLIETVYNGVDTDHFHPLERNDFEKSNCSKQILFVGRASPEKGVHILFDAFREVIKEHPEVHLELIGTIGSAPKEFIVSISDDKKVLDLSSFYAEDYRSYLLERLSSEFSGNATFTGVVPYGDLVKHYCEADIFVFPSVWNEPFGMPIIEAMACEVPVVATRGGAFTEIIEDSKTGLLVERGDSLDLAKAISRLLANKKLRDKMGAAGRKRAMSMFTWDHIADDLAHLYRSLLKSQ